MAYTGEKLIESFKPRRSSRNLMIEPFKPRKSSRSVMDETESRPMNLNSALRMGRNARRERKAEYDKPSHHSSPEVNEYREHVVSIANDKTLFRKLQKEMRNSQHSILGSQHAIHIIVLECAKETKRQAAENEPLNIRAPISEEEKMTDQGGNSTPRNRRQFFADLKVKSLPQIEMITKSFKRGRSFRQRLHPSEEKEDMADQGGNSSPPNRRQFFADLQVKSLPQIEMVTKSFKRCRSLRQRLHPSEKEDMSDQGGNSSLPNRRQCFADLKAKNQPPFEVFRNSYKRGRVLRQRLHVPPSA